MTAIATETVASAIFCHILFLATFVPSVEAWPTGVPSSSISGSVAKGVCELGSSAGPLVGIAASGVGGLWDGASELSLKFGSWIFVGVDAPLGCCAGRVVGAGF